LYHKCVAKIHPREHRKVKTEMVLKRFCIWNEEENKKCLVNGKTNLKIGRASNDLRLEKLSNYK
jgi:hypothetical protein